MVGSSRAIVMSSFESFKPNGLKRCKTRHAYTRMSGKYGFFRFFKQDFFQINNRERCLRVLIEIGDIVVHRIARGSERNNDDGPCYVSRNGICTLRVVRVFVNDIDQPPNIDRFLSNGRAHTNKRGSM